MSFDLSSVPGVLGEISRRRLSDVLSNPFIPPSMVGEVRPSFKQALELEGLSLIAEVKRKSPSQGDIAQLDPATVAIGYQQGGARAISVLTEPHYFAGSDLDLLAVKQAVNLPLLRKDFTVHPVQIEQARAMGASAVLLIVAVLGKSTADFLEIARGYGLDALVEIHDQAEMDIALASCAEIIGVNNRNLVDLKINRASSPILGEYARSRGFKGLLVAESGYDDPSQLAELKGLFDGVLIGTSLARSQNWQSAVSDILGI